MLKRMKLKIAVAASLVTSAAIIGTVLVAGLLSSDRALGPDNPDASFTPAEVAQHTFSTDCWIIIAGEVYDVTSFVDSHPGGADLLSAQCGQDATTAFETQNGEGGHSQAARDQLASLRIGSLNSTDTPAVSSPAFDQSSASVTDRYPGATILENKHNDDGSQRIELQFNGSCRELRVDSQGQITRDEDC